MKTAQQKFEELLSILQMNYEVQYSGTNEAHVKPIDSDKSITLTLENAMVTVYVDDDDIQILPIDDDIQVGIRVLDIENTLILYAKLGHGPIALSIYLYCRLLGILWGIKASPQLKDRDPLPNNVTYVELKGHDKTGTDLWTYRYFVNRTGLITVKRFKDDSGIDSFTFWPLEYLHNPEKMTIGFFEFFEKLGEIETVGRG